MMNTAHLLSIDHAEDAKAVNVAFCIPCRKSVQSIARKLVYDFVDLENIMHIYAKTGSEGRITGTSTPAVPLNLAANAAQAKISRVLEDGVVGMGGRPVEAARDGWRVQRHAEFLAVHVDKFLLVGGVPEMVHNMHRLHALCARLLGYGVTTISLPGACPVCGAWALRKNSDAPAFVYCGACGGGVSYDEYTAQVRMLIGGVV